VYRVDVCGNLVWFRLFGQSASEGGKSINETSDGGFIVAGHYAGGIGFNLRLDADGNLMWFKTYPGTSWIMYSEEADNGDILSLGHDGLKLIRCNSFGDVLWSRELGGLGNMGLYLHEMNNGDIVVSSVGSGIGSDFCLARLNSAGTMIWSKGYGSGWYDSDHTTWSNRGTVDETAGVITVTCPTYAGSMGDENILVSQVNLTTGAVVWAKSYGGASSDQSRDITPHPGGFAIVGNSASYSAPADAANNITEALSERDILLFSIDFQGELEWTRTYGGSELDKGIGVRYNIDNGYTISAYTSSPYFGNFDLSMDPLFMKTDSVGFVACQMYSPTMTVEDVIITATDQGNSTSISISAQVDTPIESTYLPDDLYVCQSCSTEPIFEPSDTLICTGEQVEFINTTEVGLTCFQEWYVNGETYNGGSDLSYSFSAPGDYTVELYSTCGGSGNTFELNLHVYEINSSYTTSDYNGYGISCFGANDGNINVLPTGGYLGAGGVFNVSWNDGALGFNRDPLIAGPYTYYVTDSIGCQPAHLLISKWNYPGPL
ncbi:MAG: hypothetical protein ACKOW8_09830, partial [Flavobacteriales bacterium]